jgi:type IV pilus assembly protein PilC
MPMYNYKARDEAGKSVHGVLEAASNDEIAAKLRKMGYMPTKINEASPGIKLDNLGARFERVRIENIVMFNLQLANMIDAGLTLLSSLQTLTKQIESKKLRDIVDEVRRTVEAGSNFSDALAQHPKVFSKLFVNMVKAGEASGKLNVVLTRLAHYVEQQEDLRQKIKGALFYPGILLCAGILVILFVVSFVMPKFVEIFTEAGVALPLPTQILYGVGVAIKSYWYLFLFFIGGLIFGVKMYIRTDRGRLQFDQLILKTPVIGPLVRKVIVSRFCRTLATLVESGVPVLQSLDIIRDVVGNEVISRVVKTVRTSVERGEKISEPLKLSEEFPPDAVHMIATGEEAGKLGQMLNKIADFYDTSLGYSIKKLTDLIEPVFLVIMGAMVGLIMASMLLPIFDMAKAIRH